MEHEPEINVPEEFDNFCEHCVSQYDGVTESMKCPDRCNQELRCWYRKHWPMMQSVQERAADECTHLNVFSITDENGRKFKKDSRVWLHKSSDKLGKRRQAQKGSICTNTPIVFDNVGIDETSLETLSKIAICNDPQCQKSKEMLVSNLTDSQTPDNTNCPNPVESTDKLMMPPDHQFSDRMSLNGASRKRKRRKAVGSVSAPNSPSQLDKDDNFVFLPRTTGYLECLNEIYDSDHYSLESDSSESIHIDSSSENLRNRNVMASSLNSNIRGSETSNIPLSSDGSLNLVGPDENISRDNVQCSPEGHRAWRGRYEYDLPVSPLGRPWRKSCSDEELEEDMQIG